MCSELLLATFDSALCCLWRDSWSSGWSWRSVLASGSSGCLEDERAIHRTRPITRKATKRTTLGIVVSSKLHSRITMMDSITDAVDMAIVTVTNTPSCCAHTNTSTWISNAYRILQRRRFIHLSTGLWERCKLPRVLTDSAYVTSYQ